MEENKTNPTEKPIEEVKPKETKRPCCEEDGFTKADGNPKKKRRLLFVSALASLLVAVALFVSAFTTFFAVYANGTALTIGIFSGLFALVESLGLGFFGFLTLLNLLTGKHRPSLIFPVTIIAVGGGEFLGDLLLLASQGYLQMSGAAFTEVFLLMFLGGALVALGVLAIFAPSILEKMGKVFVLLPYFAALVYLSIQLFLLVRGCTVTTLTFTPTLFVVLGAALIEIIGLILLLGGAKKSLKEEKESAEALLAYQTLLDKGVITAEEFAKAKEKFLE